MKRRRLWKGERGQALVEFALVLPVLVLLLVGMIEVALLMYNQQVITNASREGARFGIVAGTPRKSAAQITTVVQNYCGSRLVTFGTPTISLTINPADPVAASPPFGTDLVVTVAFPYDFLVLPNFIKSLGGAITLRAQTVMKYE